MNTNVMHSKPDPELIDDENPEWTDDDFTRARPAREVLPEIFGAEIAARMLKPRDHPPLVRINIPLSSEVLSAFQATGEGWQTRIDAVLREAVADGKI